MKISENCNVTVNGEPAKLKDGVVVWKRSVGEMRYNPNTDGGNWITTTTWIVDGKNIQFHETVKNPEFQPKSSFNLDEQLRELNDAINSMTIDDWDEFFPEPKPEPTKNVGFHAKRTEFKDDTGRLEKSLANLWNKENQPKKNVNFGMGILQDLCYKHRGEYHCVIDEEHRAVVATIIQWLGTNIGRCFLEQAFREAGWKIVMHPYKK
jgi:hypothetical protein